MDKEIAIYAGAAIAGIAFYVVYIGIILGTIWIIWNWIILPSLPYIAKVMAG